MRKPLSTLWMAAVLAAAALPVQAGVSLDRTSRSIPVCGAPINPAALYSQVVPAGGCDAGGPGPVLEVGRVAFGLVANDNVDAVSANTLLDPADDLVFIFSGDRATQGIGGSPYNNQWGRNQAAADLFQTGAAPSNSPAGVMGGPCNPSALIPPPMPALIVNQTGFNMIMTRGPGMPFLAGPIDNIDGVEMDDFDTDGDGAHDVDLYFSLDAASPSVTSPADIYYSAFGSGGFTLFSMPGQIGLAPDNNLDALVVWDIVNQGVADAGSDYALFSVAPGSSVLAGPDAVPGTADDYSPADIFVTDFGGSFCLYTKANQLALRFQDNVDGLDVRPW